MTTLTEVLGFITAEASPDDITRINGAVKMRHQYFKHTRAASVSLGAEVTLTNLSPKALNGLRGEVVAIKSARCDVLLDKDSTRTLSFARTKYAHLASTAPDGRYTLHGAPLACCEVAS